MSALKYLTAASAVALGLSGTALPARESPDTSLHTLSSLHPGAAEACVDRFMGPVVADWINTAQPAMHDMRVMFDWQIAAAVRNCERQFGSAPAYTPLLKGMIVEYEGTVDGNYRVSFSPV